MTIYYRVSPYLSTHPNPLGTDKKHIVKTCFESFKKSMTGQELIIVADKVPTDWYEFFKGYPVVKSPSGNIGSFHKQLDLASELDSDEKVFFVEDDYLWVPNSLHRINTALDELDIVSPYDHPGHYIEDRFKNQPKRMRLINKSTYREAPSNTLTFATKAKVIKKNIDNIKSFGIRDHEMFQSLEELMWVPVPGIATHLVSNLLGPNVYWNI